MREIVFDTETTGLDPKSGHRVIEIGCVELVNGIITGESFHRYVNPERDVPTEAFNVHGISSDFLVDKPLFADPNVGAAFLSFVGDSNLVAHNAGFDMKFINFELRKAGLSPIDNGGVIDTLDLARRKFPGAQNSLDALCKRFDISLASRDKHGALIDSELLANVYIELKWGRQTRLGVFLDTEQASQHSLSEKRAVRARPAPLPSLVSADERAAHDAFVETLGDASIWRKLN